jgi:chorismate--pyruvate lyase
VSDTPIATPAWLSVAHMPAELPASWRDWLFSCDSLTRRLSALAGGQFSVQPLQEGWQSLRADECRALGLPPAARGWVREVYLRGAGQAWVFARSVAAHSQGEGLDLAQLGCRSLGELLFSDQAFQRGAIEACRYPSAWLPPAMQADGLWARRSCFSRGALQVLVAEVFLPRFWQDAGL